MYQGLLNPFVSLAIRLMHILIVRFCRSTCDVQILSGLGFPHIGLANDSVVAHLPEAATKNQHR